MSAGRGQQDPEAEPVDLPHVDSPLPRKETTPQRRTKIARADSTHHGERWGIASHDPSHCEMRLQARAPGR